MYERGPAGSVQVSKMKGCRLPFGYTLFSKKGKGQFSQSRKEGGATIGWQSNPNGSSIRGASERKMIIYLYCVQYGQKHLGDCFASPKRCYIFRGEQGWWDCPYLGRGCYYYRSQGYFQRNHPWSTKFIWSQQQLIIVLIT